MPANKNITFTLPTDLIDKLRECARDQSITSLNAGVREALEEYVVKKEKEKFKNEMAKAAGDKLFLRDLKESMKSFESSDSEIYKGVEEW